MGQPINKRGYNVINKMKKVQSFKQNAFKLSPFFLSDQQICLSNQKA